MKAASCRGMIFGATCNVSRRRFRTTGRPANPDAYDWNMSSRLPRLPPRSAFILAFAVSLSLAAVGVLLGEFMHLAACPLCIVQRMLYLLLFIVAGAAIPFATSSTGRHLAALAIGLVAGVGAGVAGYQVWIQRISPTTSCSGRPAWWEEVVESAGELAPLLFRASGLCSDPAWKFANLSIAEWSLLAFTGLLLLATLTLLRR